MNSFGDVDQVELGQLAFFVMVKTLYLSHEE